MARHIRTLAQWDRQVKSMLPPQMSSDMALDETCDWVIHEEGDTAICRTHGEVADGPKSAHFPWS